MANADWGFSRTVGRQCTFRHAASATDFAPCHGRKQRKEAPPTSNRGRLRARHYTSPHCTFYPGVRRLTKCCSCCIAGASTSHSALLRPPLLDNVVARLRHLHSIIGKVEGKKRGGTNKKKGSGNRGGDVGHCRCCLHRRSATPRLAHRAGRRRPHRLTSHAPLERRNQRKRK